MRAPAAVLIDLWGTLVPGIPPSVRDAVSREMAADLGVDPGRYADAFRESHGERFTGAKPDPALFLCACEGLRVTPRECTYVGDEGGRELPAAAALGMRAARLRAPGDSSSDRYDDDTAIAGPEVSGLTDILSLPWTAPAGRLA